MFVFPDCATGLARVLDGAEVAGHVLTTFPGVLMPGFEENLPAVLFARSGEGSVSGPFATEGVQVQVFAPRWDAVGIADALVSWLEVPGGVALPDGHIDLVRVAGRPTPLPYPSETVAQVVFTVLCDTRGEVIAA